MTIDGQTVWLDSLNEGVALQRFVEQYGFSEQWERSAYGIKHAGKYYSPDFELAVDDNGNTARALVEVKEYHRNFTKDIAERMRIIANHYHTDYLFLYAVKKDEWYRLIRQSGIVEPCDPPQRGTLALAKLTKPAHFVTQNHYGRHYNQSFSDGLFSILRSAFIPSKSTRRRKT